MLQVGHVKLMHFHCLVIWRVLGWIWVGRYINYIQRMVLVCGDFDWDGRSFSMGFYTKDSCVVFCIANSPVVCADLKMFSM